MPLFCLRFHDAGDYRKDHANHGCSIVALSLQNPRTAKIVSNTTQAMVTATLLFRYIFVTKPVRIGSARLRINALLPLRPGISRPATGHATDEPTDQPSPNRRAEPQVCIASRGQSEKTCFGCEMKNGGVARTKVRDSLFVGCFDGPAAGCPTGSRAFREPCCIRSGRRARQLAIFSGGRPPYTSSACCSANSFCVPNPSSYMRFELIAS